MSDQYPDKPEKTLAERKASRRERPARPSPYTNGRAIVNHDRLASTKSYSDERPAYYTRGYYLDKPFIGRDCGKAEVWTASQQKWWYEVAKGGLFTQPLRCRPCRRRERERSEEARRIHLSGLAAKRAKP